MQRCGFLNNLTIEWAKNQCPNKTLQRYLSRGIPLVAAGDIESFDTEIVW